MGAQVLLQVRIPVATASRLETQLNDLRKDAEAAWKSTEASFSRFMKCGGSPKEMEKLNAQRFELRELLKKLSLGNLVRVYLEHPQTLSKEQIKSAVVQTGLSRGRPSPS